MYIDERSNSLLKDVIRNPKMNSIHLQEKYGLTERQVSYSFQKINSWLSSNDLPIIERSKKGMFVVNRSLLSLVDLGEQPKGQVDDYVPTEKERAQMINFILLCQDEISLAHLTSALKVSKNTILSDLKLAQQLLDPFDLMINYSRLKGYEILGEEFQKRKVLVNSTKDIIHIYQGEAMMLKLAQIEKAKIKEISKEIEVMEKRMNLQFTDHNMKSLPYVLAFLLKRMKQTKSSPSFMNFNTDELIKTQEYKAAIILLRDLDDVAQEEYLFITLILLTSSVSSYELMDDAIITNLKRALHEMLILFEKKACISFKDREELLFRLMTHMKPAYYRIKYNFSSTDIFLEKVCHEFEEVHYLVSSSKKPLEDFLGCEIPENEMAYLTMYIAGKVKEQEESIENKIKIIIVCPNGVSVSKLMENTLKKIFPEFIFLSSMSVREFKQFHLEYDLVFSPIYLETNKKLYVINQFLSESEELQLRRRVMEDLYGYSPASINVDSILKLVKKYASIQEEKLLTKELKSLLQSDSRAPHKSEGAASGKLGLSDVLTPDTIAIRQSVSSWKEAIHLAAEPLLENGSITSNYVETIINNYDYEQPYIFLGTKTAIPHASPEEGVIKTAMSLVSIKEGVSFSKDFLVHVVVLIAAVDKEQHLKALLQLSKLAQSNQIEDVVNAASKAEIINVIERCASDQEIHF